MLVGRVREMIQVIAMRVTRGEIQRVSFKIEMYGSALVNAFVVPM